MKVNDKINGFSVKRIRPLTELGGRLIEMEHDKTGLELMWIDRKEENKTFGITFRTLPWNDTGVFHILEHSVLCGSDKYRVKEPFVELLKTSMNTFLNALTFPDKTVYPVSSRNEKDFINLMRVYLDAVFCPLIYSKPEIFYQEGWHYEFDENGEVSYKGVVFNEMKGAFASADELGEVELSRALFPNSPYGFVSGGDPATIPDLTYEEFTATHKKFYSPSNAIVFLDGDIDIVKLMSIMDGEYLSHFERGEKIAFPAPQQSIDGGVRRVEYEISEEEDSEGKNRLVYGRLIGSFDDREKLTAMQILGDVLCGSNQGLLTKPLLAKGLAEDMVMQVYDSIFQPFSITEIRNIKDEDLDAVEEFVFETLGDICRNGIDRSQLEATMAAIEFKMRERDYGSMPQGIIFGLIMLETKLYGGDPIDNLEVGDLFESLKKKMHEGYFEELLREVILDNPHRAKVVLVPSRSAGEKRREKENARIAGETALWSEKDRNDFIAKQELLLSWQGSEDTPEALAAMPGLELADITAKPEKFPIDISEQNGIVTLYHDVNCAGISYYQLFFDADDLDCEETATLSLLSDLLGKMKTAEYDEAELDKMTRSVFGSLDFYVTGFSDKTDREKCKIKLCVSFGVLGKNVKKALGIVTDILTTTCFDCDETAKDIIRQNKMLYYQKTVMSGASVGNQRIAAQYNAADVAREYAGGFEYYKWLVKLDKEQYPDSIKAKLRELCKKVICKNRLTVNLTGGTAEELKDAAEYFASRLPGTEKREVLTSVIKPWGYRREGIVIPADISFACAGNIMPGFKAYDGNMAIASKILSLSYLWNVIRVQGGAYGTGFAIRTNGTVASYSYRDPNAVNSLGCYKKLGSYLADFCRETDDLTGFIIGAVADEAPLLTPRMIGSTSANEYWTGLTYEEKKKRMLDMINATPETVGSLADAIDGAYDNCGVCVIAGKNQIDNCELDMIQTL